MAIDLSPLLGMYNIVTSFQPLACFATEGIFYFFRFFGLSLLSLQTKIILLSIAPIIILIVLFILNLLIFSRLGPASGMIGGLFLSSLYNLILALLVIFTIIMGFLAFYCNFNEIPGFSLQS